MNFKPQLIKHFLLVTNTVLILLILLNTIKGDIHIADYFSLKEDLLQFQKKINSLNEEILHMEDEIEKITNSTKYARKVLRDKYHVTEPNEEIIFLAE